MMNPVSIFPIPMANTLKMARQFLHSTRFHGHIALADSTVEGSRNACTGPGHNEFEDWVLFHRVTAKTVTRTIGSSAASEYTSVLETRLHTIHQLFKSCNKTILNH